MDRVGIDYLSKCGIIEKINRTAMTEESTSSEPDRKMEALIETSIRRKRREVPS
jgi:hypothetical protein